MVRTAVFRPNMKTKRWPTCAGQRSQTDSGVNPSLLIRPPPRSHAPILNHGATISSIYQFRAKGTDACTVTLTGPFPSNPTPNSPSQKNLPSITYTHQDPGEVRGSVVEHVGDEQVRQGEVGAAHPASESTRCGVGLYSCV